MVEERTDFDTLSTDFHMCFVLCTLKKERRVKVWGGEKQRERGGGRGGRKKERKKEEGRNCEVCHPVQKC